MREPLTVVEMDVDVCSLTFGTGACPAALGPNVARKCFNTYATCPVRASFAPATKTLRYCQPSAALPVQGLDAFPAVDSVSTFSATVNLAGMAGDMGALGRRATVKVAFRDFPHHDRGLDPYVAERKTGAAQYNGIGYDPAALGTHFSKLHARWPYYNGRALRIVQGYLEPATGEEFAPDTAPLVFTPEATRHFVITDRSGPADDDSVSYEGKDVLDLAGNEKAVAPLPSKGSILADMTTGTMAVTLLPSGVGNAEYPASGLAVIGSEMVSYTRTADAITITARALAGTTLATHSAGDTFQQVLHVDNWRIDDLLEVLLRDYAKIPAGFIPKVAKWKPEVDRWLSDLRLKTHICTPTGVADLLAELSVLGFSVWWDEVAQEIGFQVSRPADEEEITPLTDDANIKAISIEDKNDERLTDIYFHSVQIDPTKSATSADNFRRLFVTTDLDAKGPRMHGDTRIRRIYCRWFNDGADGAIGVLSLRLLNRLRNAPAEATILLDAKDAALGLAGVISVKSRAVTDGIGKPTETLMQVVGRSEPDPGHEVRIMARSFQYKGRYGYCTEDTRPTYSASTDAQKARGEYAVDDLTMTFPDGTEPYKAI